VVVKVRWSYKHYTIQYSKNNFNVCMVGWGQIWGAGNSDHYRVTPGWQAVYVCVLQTYLCTAYYITMIESYTIKWTTPHCVLTLRLIGLVWDVYDGQIKPVSDIFVLICDLLGTGVVKLSWKVQCRYPWKSVAGHKSSCVLSNARVWTGSYFTETSGHMTCHSQRN